MTKKWVFRKAKGFTLIELLVVIAIIALLLSVMVPSLSLAKKKAASIVCMTNAKNLSLGWYLYQEDNNSRIMAAKDNDSIKDSAGNIIPGWIAKPYHLVPGDRKIRGRYPIVTDEDEINGIKEGALYPYIKSTDSYNCPSDKVKSLYDGTEKFVTFAIPTALAGSSGRQIERFTKITSPSMRYNFVETAEERNWTASHHWIFGAPEYTGRDDYIWWSPMAVNHGNASVLGFCDGHAEVHNWLDKETRDRVTRLSKEHTDNYGTDKSGLTSNNSQDLAFMAQGWAYRR